jgi:hypothetical protein
LRAGTATCRSKTAQKFITHPLFGRLYRTGDKCKIDIQTQRVHFLGRIDAQLKVRGHRVEAEAVEDVLRTQFSEIEAAVLDYQNEALVAFVLAPSVCEGEISVVAPAPAEWAARVTGTLAKQLPAPSVPTRIFLVEKFVMKPVSGKIDRSCLPNLSHVLRNAEPEGEDTLADTAASARDREERDVNPPDADAGMDPESEEVLAICRAVFETPLGLDDGFVEAGAHSIDIARLAQRLQAAGWMVTVRALLSDCNTARRVANRPQALQQASKVATAPVKSDENSAERDEAAAEVLSIGYFTTMQVLFAIFLYSPGLVVFLSVLGFGEVGTFFTTASLWEFIIGGFFLYLLGLLLPFASLLWVMMIKFFMGGDIYKNNVTPGVYPKWSKMHLRIWCIGRLENIVLLLLRAMPRSAPLMAFVLRQLGVTVGVNLQRAHDSSLSGPLDLISIEDDVAIQTGAYIQTTRWSGQVLFNLVPEVATADSRAFWSNGCFTNMLDCGAEHLKLRQLDMPRNFFSGNNCVAEYGHFPSNFLLGVSTPGNDIQFRRQMRSRLGEPITVAGNPPVKFASASFEAENETHRLPNFPLFLTRVFLNDIFGVGTLSMTEGLIFTILYICLLRLGGHPVASAVIALLLGEVNLVLFCVAIKKSLVGSEWGADDSTPFWSWRHFAYFFAQDCFFVWCRGPLGFCAGTILSNAILRWMGSQIGHRTIVTRPMQCSDWNAVNFGNDCVIDGFLQFHTFENMILKVKRTEIKDGCAISFGATVMGGAIIERDTTLLPLSLVLKEMNMLTATYEGSPAQPVSGSILLPLALRRQRLIDEENRFTRPTVPDDAKREPAPRHKR